MVYKITYTTYNNTDFKRTVFCKTKEGKDFLIEGLKKLKHVSDIKTEEEDDECNITFMRRHWK